MMGSRLLLLGLAAVLVASSHAQGSGDDASNDLYDPNNYGDDDSAHEFDEKDYRDDAMLQNEAASKSSGKSAGGAAGDDSIDSGQVAAIVILCTLIVVALGVTGYYLKKTRDLQSDALQGLIQDNNSGGHNNVYGDVATPAYGGNNWDREENAMYSGTESNLRGASTLMSDDEYDSAIGSDVINGIGLVGTTNV